MENKKLRKFFIKSTEIESIDSQITHEGNLLISLHYKGIPNSFGTIWYEINIETLEIVSIEHGSELLEDVYIRTDYGLITKKEFCEYFKVKDFYINFKHKDDKKLKQNGIWIDEIA